MLVLTLYKIADATLIFKFYVCFIINVGNFATQVFSCAFKFQKGIILNKIFTDTEPITKIGF